MNNNTITLSTTKNTPKTITKNTTTINTARTSTFATPSSTKTSPDLSTISTTTTFSTDLAAPTHYNNSTETIDIAGEIIKDTQKEITSSPIFIPIVGLLFALIPVFVFCLCYARC